MSEVLASVRDASWLNYPRHDGPGGHAPEAWGPKYHVVIDHPVKGASWSACGKMFLSEGGDLASKVPSHQRCRLNGCKQRFAEVGEAA